MFHGCSAGVYFLSICIYLDCVYSCRS